MDLSRAQDGSRTRTPGCGWYLSASLLCAVGVYGGTVWTVRSWADCPLGNDVSNTIGLQMLIALTLLYRWGMGWPSHPPGGQCMEGYPLFPFTGKTGPHTAN